MNRVLNRTKFDNNLPACVEQVDKKKKKNPFQSDGMDFHVYRSLIEKR